MSRVLRGDIRWAALGRSRSSRQAGSRPVLVLSEDVFNERSGTAIAVALTRRPQRAGFPLTVEIRSKGLERRSWANSAVSATVPVWFAFSRKVWTGVDVKSLVVPPRTDTSWTEDGSKVTRTR